MPSLKHIKRRVAGIKNMKQITKAMNLVAASKLQKCKQRIDAVRPMFNDIQNIMKNASEYENVEHSVFFNQRESKTVAYVLISSDKGLCGGYNVNVSKEALGLMRNNADKSEIIITAGSKGRDYLKRRGKDILKTFDAPSETGSSDDSREIGTMLCTMFLNNEIDEAYVVYTGFKTVLTHIPRVTKLLPITAQEDSTKGKGQVYKGRMIFDPDVDGFLKDAVPMYLNTVIQGAMVEASVCEWASRMTSMDSATNNAAEIIEDLTLVLNRTRQGIITQEITEIVSGANALQ